MTNYRHISEILQVQFQMTPTTQILQPSESYKLFSGAGTLGVPLWGPRRVGGLLGVAGRLSGTISPGVHTRLPRGVRPRLEGKPRTPLSSRVATRVSWSPLSGLKGDPSVAIRRGEGAHRKWCREPRCSPRGTRRVGELLAWLDTSSLYLPGAHQPLHPTRHCV